MVAAVVNNGQVVDDGYLTNIGSHAALPLKPPRPSQNEPPGAARRQFWTSTISIGIGSMPLRAATKAAL
ncbi:hypothetical protein ABFA25_01005 [Mycobacterium lepromatosis]|uniref:hypothetical protein n=1 Tax=Mycobacterium lepromatosis TaxID=480418 RepID=UPI000A88FE76|nr:hypothetical protein [Mycobacterium lepromatosis]